MKTKRKARKKCDRLIRLACSVCDATDGDGVTLEEALAAGWTDIHPSPPMPDSYEWWDHLGLCKDCCE